jgi:hypothetical protein
MFCRSTAPSSAALVIQRDWNELPDLGDEETTILSNY